MYQSVQQLDALVSFIRFSPALVSANENERWADFVRIYNGPQYRPNNYDTDLEKVYASATN
jgi:N-acetylmuramidase